ncbi:nuclear transport factor 2 family protein [Streptomyces sp. NRRL WC-3742]|uniref:nuclear transport factor 2 family protein n=1 Tax=Streptomyces sp. NRRL WC-3742 TaxID=1463934 RepID=UPI0004C79A75|nr:nuclear transport factor 2 family protein [Streptomyces sp. NRRL WC-3742]
MSPSAQEIFQRYVHAGPLTRDADAFAELFTEDGVFEAPLLPEDTSLPRRIVGREAIRRAMAAHYAQLPMDSRVPNVEKSAYVLHATADPEVFIAEIDTAFDTEDGEDVVSLVQVFRTRDGLIAKLRDYFSPALLA